MIGRPKRIELLAPARDLATAIAAIDHGADAVYIGGPSHGARSAAGNSLADLATLCDYAHGYGAKVFATVNTLVYDDEIESVRRMVGDLWRIGVDALIVQDLSLLTLDIPPIELHASTQCDIRTPGKARFLADAGFSRVVVPREMSLDEVAAVSAALGPSTEIEAFVHGALCVSYSGDCQAGCLSSRRSANRGECPQLCRLAYDLLDAPDGRVLVGGKHLLSLRDLNRMPDIEAMIRAGVTSFKIEGRLKDVNYVKNVTAAYRRAIDEVLSRSPELGVRASDGRSTVAFTPDVNESFNRGFTSYFTHGRPAGNTAMAAVDSPKWCGVEVGTVISQRGNTLKARLQAPLANGDGLGWFDAGGRFNGFRLNRVEGSTLMAAGALPRIPAGTKLMRNRNKAFDDQLDGATAKRVIDVDLTLRLTPGGRLTLDAADRCGNRVSLSLPEPVEASEARTPQAAQRERTLRKTGDTRFEVATVTDLCGDVFIQMRLVADLRRQTLELLERTRRLAYRPALRRQRAEGLTLPAELMTLDYHANVANRLARDFYEQLGAKVTEPALEVAGRQGASERRVMATRYCIRRELGECLRTDCGRRRLPAGDLWLRSGAVTMRVEFDCRRCGMNLYMTPPKK